MSDHLCCEHGDCERPATGQDDLGTWLCNACADNANEAAGLRLYDSSQSATAAEPTRKDQR